MKFNAEFLRDSAVISITTRCSWGINRKADKSKVQVQLDSSLQGEERKQAEAEAKRRMELNKRLISLKEYDAIKSFMAAEKNRLISPATGYCQQFNLWGKKGIFLASMKRPADGQPSAVEMIEEAIKAAEAKIKIELIPAMITAYEPAVMREKEIMEKAGQFKGRDYPGWNGSGIDKVAARQFFQTAFGMSVDYIPVDVPENLPPEIKKKAIDRMNSAIQENSERMLWQARFFFSKSLDHLIEKLSAKKQEGEDGKNPRFYESNIEKVRDFIRTFPFKNAINDAQLAALVERGDTLLKELGMDEDSLDIKRFKKNENLRDMAADKLATVKQELDSLLETAPERMFQLFGGSESAETEGWQES